MANTNTQVNTVEALAVALYAFKCNTKVVKVDDREELTPNIKYLLNYFLNTESDKITLTPELIQEAENLQTWFGHSLTMNLLANTKINQFQSDISQLVLQETVSMKKFGMLVWAPKLHADQQARDQVKQEIMYKSSSSRHIGALKKPLQISFTLLEKRFHRNYNCWTALGHDEHGNLVRFMTKHENLCKSGQIRGKVKDHGNERYHSMANITTLNFVKAV